MKSSEVELDILEKFEVNKKYKFSYEQFEKAHKLYTKEKVPKSTESIFQELDGLEVTIEFGDAHKTMNYAYVIQDGKKFGGIMPHWCKKVRCIDTGEIFYSLNEAGEKYKISASSITECCKGKRKRAKGMILEYVEVE